MSGFDKDWLALREPVDREARCEAVLAAVRTYAEKRKGPLTILDIGCGTGSTYRALAPIIGEARWRLLDYDRRLLDEASALIGREDIDYRCQDLTDLDALPLDGVDIVTASAFFDLCSAEFCEEMAARLADRGIALYAALNYDGRISWTSGHPLDDAIVRDFNCHQKTDKGLGPALGPLATAHLSGALRSLGYGILTGNSVWRMGRDEQDLQRLFVRGMVEPVLEIGSLSRADVEAWRDMRLDDLGNGSCTVGHVDLLALPAI